MVPFNTAPSSSLGDFQAPMSFPPKMTPPAAWARTLAPASTPQGTFLAPEGLFGSGIRKKRLQMQCLHHPLHTVPQKPEARCAITSASAQRVISLELAFSKCLPGHSGPRC